MYVNGIFREHNCSVMERTPFLTEYTSIWTLEVAKGGRINSISRPSLQQGVCDSKEHINLTKAKVGQE